MRKVNKGIYLVLAMFLGGAGIHKFYAGKWIMGFLYLGFSWTYIPIFLSLFDVIVAAFKPSDEYGMIRM